MTGRLIQMLTLSGGEIITPTFVLFADSRHCTFTGKNICSLFQAWPAVVRIPMPLVNSCP